MPKPKIEDITEFEFDTAIFQEISENRCFIRERQMRNLALRELFESKEADKQYSEVVIKYFTEDGAIKYEAREKIHVGFRC